jgi:predicted amidohydrolase YtcJ
MLIHCTGDRANVMALDAYEKVIRGGDPRTLMRIEHLGDFLLGPGVLERSRALDVKANVQPGWIYTLANVMINNLGEERAKAQSFQFRTMIDAGLEPGYGSDLTGFVRETENPFMHIQAAVTRGAADGTTFVPEQAVTVDEALRMMTIWSARAQGEGHLKGSIEPGKLADFAVLSDDITRVAPTTIRDVSVVTTVVGGEVVYEA